MTAFRILDNAPQYLLPNGQVNAGGSLTFYETDLTTLKDTWSNVGLSALNENPVEMDAAGRTETDVWGDGEYGVVMKDAAGSVIWTRNNVRAAGDAAQEIPALVAGAVLSNDGSNLLWEERLELPDPTGSSGYILSTDGVNVQWIPAQSIPEPDIDVGTVSLTVGEGSGERFAFQTGTFTVPSSGSRTSNVAITFPVGFTKILAVIPMASTYAVNSFGAGATITAEGFTAGSPATGATIVANSVDDGGDSGDEILNPVLGTWLAVGLVAAA